MAFPLLIPLITAALSAAGSIYSANNQPKPAGNLQTGGSNGPQPKSDAQSVFSINSPQKAPQTPMPVAGNWSPDALFQMILQGGQTPGSGVLQPPSSSTPPPGAQPAPASTPSPAQTPTGSAVLQQIPEALAAVAPLLAMANQRQYGQTHVVGAQGGGAGGQLVPGLNLPQRRTVGELLASLPRPHYG